MLSPLRPAKVSNGWFSVIIIHNHARVLNLYKRANNTCSAFGHIALQRRSEVVSDEFTSDLENDTSSKLFFELKECLRPSLKSLQLFTSSNCEKRLGFHPHTGVFCSL